MALSGYTSFQEKERQVIHQFSWRRIGNVNIFEVQGELAGPLASRTHFEISQVMKQNPSSSVLLDLRQIENIDGPSAEVMVSALGNTKKSGILSGKSQLKTVFQQTDHGRHIPVFDNEYDAVLHFGREFAQYKQGNDEKRKFPRLKTALPVEFEYRDPEQNQNFVFHAVATNLGGGGLYADFFDAKTQEFAQLALDPFDLKLLKIHLSLFDGKIVDTTGKVLRIGEEFPQTRGLAVEFYKLQEDDRMKIEGFLKSNDIIQKEEAKK